MKLVVDEGRCQGHNVCHGLAPGLFVIDDFGAASPATDADLDPTQAEAAKRAAANCPERAISLVERPEGT
jgi:ferredoxin